MVMLSTATMSESNYSRQESTLRVPSRRAASSIPPFYRADAPGEVRMVDGQVLASSNSCPRARVR